MNKLKTVSILFRIFGVLCFATAVVLSLQLWVAGRQFGQPNQAVTTSILALLNFVGSTAISALLFYVGKLISTRRRFALCKGVSIFVCLIFPFGTALGAYSLSVLSDQKDIFS